jgi:hypothetical protein
MKPYNDSPRLLRIFLIHSSGDKPAVRQLYRRLRADGFEPWLDEEKLVPGQRWRDEIPRAVRESDLVLICLSKASASKVGFVQREIKYALDIALEQPEGAIFLIPLKLEECDLPEALGEWQWVNFFEDQGYERLMRALSFRAEVLGVEVRALDPAVDSSRARNEGSSSSFREIFEGLFGKQERAESQSRDTPSVKVATGVDEQGGTVLQHAIGIETLGGVFTKLIPEGTRLPHRHSEVFSTATDNQTSVEIHVLAGLRPLAKQNLSLGKFHFIGIPPAPRGMPQIEVTFDIDVNGIVNVSAKDMNTGREQKITIESASGPSQEEINKIVSEARMYSSQDSRKLEEIEARNRLDGLLYQVEKVYKEHRERFDAVTRSQVEAAISTARKALDTGEVAHMNTAFSELQSASHKIAAALYTEGKR